MRSLEGAIAPWNAAGLFPRVGFVVSNRTDPARGVVRFCNGGGACEQWIKEGGYAVEWMHRHASCRARQREQCPQDLTIGRSTCRSRLPRPDVQVPRYWMGKCRCEWLAVQPTIAVPSLIWVMPV